MDILIPSFLRRSVNSKDVYCEPWSEFMQYGLPYFKIAFLTVLMQKLGSNVLESS